MEASIRPADQLFTLGRPRVKVWPDYGELGLSNEHLRDLIEIATDERLLRGPATDPEVYAPVHAWRVLGQLGNSAAIPALIGVLAEAEENDWAGEELPLVFECFGSVAVAELVEYLLDPSNGEYARAAAGAGLVRIARRDSVTRPLVVEALTLALEGFEESSDFLNGLIIGSLLDLNAVEAASTVERAFAAGRVDLWMNGDWEDVQIELGLLSSRSTPRRSSSYRQLAASLRSESGPGMQRTTARDKGGRQKKAKKKLAKRGRKANRRRK